MLSIVSKKSIGVDIADNSIEVAELKKIGGKIIVGSLGRVSLPSGIVKNGTIIDGEKLTEALNNVLSQAKPKSISGKRIIFAFPERQTFFHIFSYKNEKGQKGLSKEDINSIVLKEAWSNIPIAKNKMMVDFQVLEKNKDDIKILIVATEKRLVLEWHSFFEKMKLDVDVFDIEALANFRHIANISDNQPTCLVDMGSASTNIFIFKKNKLFFEHTIDIAGNAITAEISKSLKIKKEEAEKNKINFGIADTDSPYFSIIIKVLENILSEIKAGLDNFKIAEKQEVKRLVFIGGSSQLKGLVEFFETNLGVSTCLGKSKFLKEGNLEYLGAVGIALRGLNKGVKKQDPKIPFLKDEIKTDLGLDGSLQDLSSSVYSQESEGDFLLDGEGEKRDRELFAKKVFLIIVLIVGIILIPAAFIWRNYEKDKKQEEVKALFQQINNLEVIAEENLITEENNINIATEIVSSEATSTEKETESQPRVVIKKTNTGWLNVRQGPGTNYDIIAKVLPGEIYGIAVRDDGWININISEELEGWVYGEYTEEIN